MKSQGVLKRFRLNHQGPKELLEIWRLATRFSTGSEEILASTVIRYESLFEPLKKLFEAYDRFIGFMADERAGLGGKSPRDHLNELDVANLETDPVYSEAREIRRAFGTALAEIFLEPKSELYNATIRYGVF
jgi:hypothetical protein